jgi:hypothetical protein
MSVSNERLMYSTRINKIEILTHSYSTTGRYRCTLVLEYRKDLLIEYSEYQVITVEVLRTKKY